MPDTCKRLRHFIEEYHAIAAPTYEHIPKYMSIMYLTICEIVVECDKLACSNFPLLREYDPEIPIAKFRHLVLPRRTHRDRLHIIKTYFKSRYNNSIVGLPSLYRGFGHPQSFAVRYFNINENIKKTLADLERNAAIKRTAKLSELSSKQRKHDTLIETFDNTECESYKAATISHRSPTSLHRPTAP
jgi:hypothetical protein